MLTAALAAVAHSIRKLWQDLLTSRAGKRFQHFHAAHESKRSGWGRALTITAAVICVAIGVVLAFIPGPAVVFFALALALLSTQSHWLARKSDRAELFLRALWRKHQRRRRQRRNPRRPPKVALPVATRYKELDDKHKQGA